MKKFLKKMFLNKLGEVSLRKIAGWLFGVSSGLVAASTQGAVLPTWLKTTAIVVSCVSISLGLAGVATAQDRNV